MASSRLAKAITATAERIGIDPQDPILKGLKRSDARTVKDHMLADTGIGLRLLADILTTFAPS